MISLIAAVGANGELGVNGELPWNIPEDMKYFRRMTINKTVIMGRKTYQSLGGAMPDRRNIVLTKNHSFKPKDAIVAMSVEEALSYITPEENVFIIGGGEIYDAFMPFASRIYLTEIESIFHNADAHFPPVGEDWFLAGTSTQRQSLGYKYSFNLYMRKGEKLLGTNDFRITEVLRGEEWVKTPFEELKLGDIVRIRDFVDGVGSLYINEEGEHMWKITFPPEPDHLTGELQIGVEVYYTS